jgi:Tim10/DDP family zinc finger
MSSGEMNCLARCCDRYVDATKVVSGTVVATYKREEALGGGLQ